MTLFHEVLLKWEVHEQNGYLLPDHNLPQVIRVVSISISKTSLQKADLKEHQYTRLSFLSSTQHLSFD